jgi:hypothetical protein
LCACVHTAHFQCTEEKRRIKDRKKEGRKKEKRTGVRAIVVISFLFPISVEGVIRRLRWGIGPKEAEALSS